MYTALRLLAVISTATHFRNVGESVRRSTTTSNAAPAVQRTSFTSSCGAHCQCMPRSVPARVLNDALHCTHSVQSPCAANSSRQNVRANSPRSSARGSGSITNTPGNSVERKRIRGNPQSRQNGHKKAQNAQKKTKGRGLSSVHLFCLLFVPFVLFCGYSVFCFAIHATRGSGTGTMNRPPRV